MLNNFVSLTIWMTSVILLCLCCSGAVFETPCSTKYTDKYCETQHSCQYDRRSSNSLLVGIDGTGSRNWLQSAVSHNQYTSPLGIANNKKWIWKSNVANFFEDYLGESRYFHGPDANELIRASEQVHDIVDDAMSIICQFTADKLNETEPAKMTSEYIKELSLSNRFGIDLVGFSRGGFAAMEISRKLQSDGCRVHGVHIKPMYVRFMGLYDPVQRDIDYEDVLQDQYDNEKVASNVISVSVAERSAELGSRSYFGYGVRGFDDPRFPQKRWIRRFSATHGGVGGYPGEGDCMENPPLIPFDRDIMKFIYNIEAKFCAEDYSVAAEKEQAPFIDMFMRDNAIESGVPIQHNTERYYNEYHTLFSL